MIVKGRHVAGMGGANRSVKRQKKIFHRLGLPGAIDLYDGTINLDTSPYGFRLVSFDYLFSDVKHKSFPRKRVETFGFITIEKLFYKSITYENWGYIYIPHNSPHFGNEQMFELIGRKIEGFNPGDALQIHVDDKHLRALPYPFPMADK